MTPTPHERRTLVLLGVLYAAVVIPIGVHKGGDLTNELQQSDRLLAGAPLYLINPPKGIWWPPFTAAGLVPFALIARWSVALAKACWAVLNVFCLGWSLALARRWTSGWAPIVLALAAVAKPLQSNFEHLNLTPILLGPILAATADLEDGRDARAGAWIGLATAIKGFPALLLLYCAYRGRWRAAGIGLAVAAALTLGAMLPFGPVGAARAVIDWLQLSAPTTAPGRYGTQSLPGFAAFLGWSPATVIALELTCVAAAMLALRRRPDGDDLLPEVGLVTLVAVLVSPIAWLYYATLTFPAWVAVLRRPLPPVPWLRGLALAAGVLTSGILTFGLYPDFLGFIRDPNYTWGMLALSAVVITQRLLQPQPVTQPT